MSPLLDIKAILPKAPLQVDVFREELLNALHKEGRDVDREMNATVSTWNDKPSFKSKITLTRGSAEGGVLTEIGGSEEAKSHFTFVDKGTRIRWALMSSDWKSKTSPGSLRSGRGSGSVVIAGRRAMMARGIAPRPGIEARNFTKDIQENRVDRFEKAMAAAMVRGASKVWK